MPTPQRQLKSFLENKAQSTIERMEKTPTKKLIVVLLVIFSVAVPVLGYMQIKSRLDKPFFADRLVEDKASIRGPLDVLQAYINRKENKDYLYTEVVKPAVKTTTSTSGATTDNPASQEGSPDTSANLLNPQSSTTGSGSTDVTQLTADQKAQLKQTFTDMTLDQLRLLLVDQGVSQAEVEAMSDQSLLQAKQSLLNSLQ